MNPIKTQFNIIDGAIRKAFSKQQNNTKQIFSNCCGSEVNENHDVCPLCGEHCGGVDGDDNEYSFTNEWAKD